MEALEHKYFGKTLGDVNINEVYAEKNRCKSMEERYWKRRQEGGTNKDFRKYVFYKQARVRCEEIIRRYKLLHKGKPWEEAQYGRKVNATQ